MITSEIANLAVGRAAGDAPWPSPEALTDGLSQQPYPVDALPETLRAAVLEVQAFVQTPLPMTAFCALSALSIAAQAHVDVQRADLLTGPISLFSLVVADSGERKSTLDRFFTETIRNWERRQGERLKPELQKYEAENEIWTAKRNGLKEAIKLAAKMDKESAASQEALRALEHSRPVPPRVPKVLRVDDTPEALAWHLAKEWPSAAVVTSEAGLVFGSHGMGRETIMRNLALLNILWDGGSVQIGRRTSESFTVDGARLTVSLQIQEATFRAFLDASKGLVRGTGFMARFLICWPASTQGTRRFTEAPTHWPALAAFRRRIEDLLNTPAPTDTNGTLKPTMMALSPIAKERWVQFHDGIEEELRDGGELVDVRDVASKAADNAVRLAALFCVLEQGTAGQIQPDHMNAAARIAAWHLSEAQRFLREVDLPPSIRDAVRLERFLIEQYRQEGGVEGVSRRTAQNRGPVREGKRMDAVLAKLAEVGRVRTEVRGTRVLLAVNPALLAGTAQ